MQIWRTLYLSCALKNINNYKIEYWWIKDLFFAILSALLVSAGILGSFSSCNLSKANGNLPAVKDSTALFDYFTYKGDDDFYKENPLPDDESFL